ncbi:DUF427 domain-containing protein [Anoxynatronum buryatiense]|uniref:Uncharacterized conserved protein, DUF427 family n=1 Tax=Anoxynatronum buryatiense TaxID=489973 RepID=A0AA46AI42_9CLOT|nr:DUF427 domain-containing protein [Anoxynatronum buryatiense]SMP45864.1 Uncharacterized conserved protein, DUF427 family [Anoxynatronum buryatiense]
MKAMYQGVMIAQSNRTLVVEGNHYFPEQDVHMHYLEPSDFKSICPWKGEAGYYHVEVRGQRCSNAAWYYPYPKEKATHIRSHIAFWKEVEVLPD